MKKTKKQKEGSKSFLLMVIYTTLITVGVVILIYILVSPKQQTIVQYMFENDVKLLKTDSCGWCQKQLLEFTQEELWDMQDSSLVVECNQNGTWICGDTGTPAWWVNGTVVYSGYVERDDIIKMLESYK